MNDSLDAISGAPQPAPCVERAVHRESGTPNRWPRYVSFLILLAAISTVAGYQVARLEIAGARWFHTAPLLASAPLLTPARVPASDPRAKNADLEAISHLAPQQQAERLLELAIHRPDQSLGLIGGVDGKFEKALGLLLGRQVADCFKVGVFRSRIGGRHSSGRKKRRGRQ